MSKTEKVLLYFAILFSRFHKKAYIKNLKHLKLHLCWVEFTYPMREKGDKQPEINMSNTSLMQECPTQPMFQRLALGIIGSLGWPGLALGTSGFALGQSF